MDLFHTVAGGVLLLALLGAGVFAVGVLSARRLAASASDHTEPDTKENDHDHTDPDLTD